MTEFRGGRIEVVDVTHRYRHGHLNAVENINFEIQSCETTALVGRSGCGKSTLLNLMAGLLLPSQGVIRIDGQVVKAPSPKWIVMFQQASLYPWMTVSQSVALGLRFIGRKSEAKTRVPELLELVELSDYADRNVQDLSGGQQQRVALARSLAVHPEVLFLDEPFSSLDTFTRSALQRDMRRIASEIGITVVLVTHDISEATIMADRAIIMSADPGRARSDVSIKLSDEDRLQAGLAYEKATARLRKEFEAVAGAISDENSQDSDVTEPSPLHEHEQDNKEGTPSTVRNSNALAAVPQI